MEPEELKKTAEEARGKGEKAVGLTLTIMAVLLAVVTLLSHRAHTEEVTIQGDRNTQWVNYDTKRMQGRMYDSFADLFALQAEGKEKSAEYKEKAKAEREGEPAKNGKPAKLGADKVLEKAQELDAEMVLDRRRADRYDAAELFLEISIVLGSITLLAGIKQFWRLSFVTAALGIGIALWGFFLH